MFLGILLNAKNHVVFSLVVVAVFVVCGVHGLGSSLHGRRSRRAGEVFRFDKRRGRAFTDRVDWLE